jgi:ATP-dependent Zn protease
MAPKKSKKSAPKKVNPPIRIPKDAQVKIIEITPRSFLIPIIVIALLWALYSMWASRGSEQITYNDKVGLNEIRQNYQSGSYEEVVISNREIQGRHQKTSEVDGSGKKIDKRKIDRTSLPIGVSATDIGLTDPKNPTKVTNQNNDWSNAFFEFLPTLGLTLITILGILFLMSRMSGGGM